MSDPEDQGLVFVSLGDFLDPRKVERCSAALREREIPHRTEWRQALMVPEGWAEEAREAVLQALTAAPGLPEESPRPTDRSSARRDTAPEMAAAPADSTAETSGDDEESDEFDESAARPMFGRGSLFDREYEPPSADELKSRAVWPAWALGALFGLGLGHLYAGKTQMFCYLVFASFLGGAFYHFTHSYLSFLMNLFAWAVDLGFAAYHVKEHNRRAERLRKQVDLAEHEFLESVR